MCFASLPLSAQRASGFAFSLQPAWSPWSLRCYQSVFSTRGIHGCWTQNIYWSNSIIEIIKSSNLNARAKFTRNAVQDAYVRICKDVVSFCKTAWERECRSEKGEKKEEKHKRLNYFWCGACNTTPFAPGGDQPASKETRQHFGPFKSFHVRLWMLNDDFKTSDLFRCETAANTMPATAHEKLRAFCQKH